ncbi:MAG: hypothetical protein HY685_06230 [Chloroflexi bacterium]|nr:hypothetical protein [Chloroflexota bacterium]
MMHEMDFYQVMGDERARALVRYLATTNRAIVARLEECFRYVSLRRENGDTFSYEFASILRDACSAFGSFTDGVARAAGLARRYQRASSIKDFFSFYDAYSWNAHSLTQTYIEVTEQEAPDLRNTRRLQPFSEWTRSAPPSWWTAHNKIKHSEYLNAHEGNLRNAMNAVAALELILKSATQNEKGTRLFSSWGAPWKPGQRGTEHIERLFDP